MIDTTIFLSLGLLLGIAKIFGELTERLKLSSLVGEIFAGILLGPILGIVVPNDIISFLAYLGALCLLFLGGLSTNFDEIKGDVYTASALAMGGGLFSLFLGFLVSLYFLGDILPALIIGFSLVGTSTVITIRSLIELGEFHSRPGKMLLAIEMADEVLSIIILSIAATIASRTTILASDIMNLFFLVLGFFLFVLTFGSKVVNGFLHIIRTMKDEQIILSISLSIVFLIAFLSEQVGVAAITGAFLTGMAMNKSQLVEPVIVPKVKTLGYGFLIPLFFAYSAINMNIHSLFQSIGLIISLLVVAFVGKFVGSGIFSKFFGFREKEQYIIGIGTVPRGEFTIILAQIGFAASLITTQVYTAIISFVIVTIVITPILLTMVKKWF
jgi:Kef-type K+ transport system membrane component KefB